MKNRRNNIHHHNTSPNSTPPSDTESGSAAAACAGSQSPQKEQDRFLPIANVSRIMKRSLPANAKISKEAKETVQECVSEFISFVTGEASDKCQREKQKTINGDDLLWAMTTLGFESYVIPLKSYLARYRELEGEKAAVSAAPGGNSDKIGEVGGADILQSANSGEDGVSLDMQIFGFYAAGPTSAVGPKSLGEGSGGRVVDFDMAREQW
ncbi:hypothetical protein LUZ61_009393 [Rhynchospora tenuis]|uniref:Transcription factor CBF/NF-Y/archaeal histone domain-containing protein n=1 Tax=Rhynchospora tenuis TaxID=198213 RepID=A0AAD6EYL9_9POAL|nr:hypothetical protein LUZ61_009393 [Rhynchospora tenuis]